MLHELRPYFKRQMKICNLFLLTPYDWPNESKFPMVHKSLWRRLMYKVTLLGEWVYVGLMTVNFVLTISNAMTRSDKSKLLLGLVFLICFSVTLSMRTVILCKEKGALEMMCSFLRFEQFNPEAKTEKPDTMGKVLMTLGVVTSFGLPGLMVAILIVDPCKPPHLGYILYGKSVNGCSVPHLVPRVTLLLFDFFMWVNSIAPACYYVFEFMFVGLRCMDHYVQMITRKMNAIGCSTKYRKVPSPDSAPSTKLEVISPTVELGMQPVRRIQFGTLEPHHAHGFHMYRQIYLLNRKYDHVLQGVFIPSIIAAACSCIIISLYACFKLHRLIPMPGLAFFPLLATDGLSVIFIVEVAAGVLKQSNRFLESAKTNWKFNNRSLFKKVAKSLGKIKVRFGSTNFIDQLTPFVFIDFCLTNTVNLMLIT